MLNNKIMVQSTWNAGKIRFYCILSFVFCLFFLIGSYDGVRASEIMHPAAHLETGKIGWSFFATGVENDLEFSAGSGSVIRIPLSNGTTTQFFSNADVTQEYEGNGQRIVLQATMRPWDGLQYFARFGVGEYEVRIPSGSVLNRLSSDKLGYIWGVGMRWTYQTDTPVTPAIALEASYTRSVYAMDKFSSELVEPVGINQRFTLEEVQGALVFSNKYVNRRIEPFGGVKFAYQVGRLRDKNTADQLRGSVESTSPFFGLRVRLFDKEYFVIEGSVLGETMVSGGVSLGF